MSSTQKYRITLDMLRMAKRRLKKRQVNPCFPLYEKLINAMEAADYSAQALNRYVKDLEACFEKYDAIDSKKGTSSTLYRLTKHLDRQKTPKK